MRIIVGISHPKHVYIFKNVIYKFIKNGHEVKVVAIDKEITEYLLKKFNINYIKVGKNQPTLDKKLLSLPRQEYLTYKIAKEFRPDIFIGRAIPHIAHISWLLKKPFIVFEDTEIAKSVHKITLPFASQVVTPKSYWDNLGTKHIRFNGYFEQGYLNSNYFKPDPLVLDGLQLNGNEKLILVRFVAWNASHDVGDTGFSDKIEVVKKLSEHGRVLISSEIELPKELQIHKLSLPQEKVHDLMYYADLFIGESATMATECAIIGTPAIFVSTSRRGYTNELESKYDLLYTFSSIGNSQKDALNKAIGLLEDEHTREKWKYKSNCLLNETIDVTEFISSFVENYVKLNPTQK